MAKTMTLKDRLIGAAGEEMRKSPPKILAHTREKFGAKRAAKQRVAIMLNKARRAGARIPKKKKKSRK